MRLCGEKRDGSLWEQCLYVYNAGGYEPLARVDTLSHDGKSRKEIHYYHAHLNGLPEELTSDGG
ncbi:hypothetical protein C8D90_1152 [Enterobacillus tribolii]|uniref:Uncharacterized protein n=1 Tax=Enterobacillus tribolii TaxID=1487935 RepID=A0A370Q687_9GAMM|nr:hypothetical protein C8D90_1152 [Enterobacillus tribolii]